MRGICMFIVANLYFKTTIASSDDHIITNHSFLHSSPFPFTSTSAVVSSHSICGSNKHLMNWLFLHMEIDEHFSYFSCLRVCII